VRRYFPGVPTPEEVSGNFDAALEMARLNGFHFGAARLRSDDSFVGLLGLGLIPDDTREAIASRPRVEIGWMLCPRFWGRGLASEGARAWLDFAWSLGLPEVVAFTAALNRPSRRVMERIGMAPADEFLHPRIEAGHPLRPHILYRIVNPASQR
jgi:RimJ/RimL family protein N-acetyltransferase